jgi:hypothetical protein
MLVAVVLVLDDVVEDFQKKRHIDVVGLRSIQEPAGVDQLSSSHFSLPEDHSYLGLVKSSNRFRSFTEATKDIDLQYGETLQMMVKKQWYSELSLSVPFTTT